MMMMLRAKLKISMDLRNQFNEIINQNKDHFGKNMQGELRKVILKANKDHMLDMKEEQ